MDNAGEFMLSVGLNVMGRIELAEYGFRGWMLQDCDRAYEVVLNLFNDARPRFEKLAEDRNPNCRLTIRTYDRPDFFNISAANNLVIHAATGSHILFANADMIYTSKAVRQLSEDLAPRDVSFLILSRANLTEGDSKALGPPIGYRKPGDLDFVEALPSTAYWTCTSGWIVRRGIARAVGGFDPNVLVAEDVDILHRVGHYMARHRLQNAVLGMPYFFGYHVWHSGSELFHMYREANLLLTERAERLKADPNSADDVLPTQLDSLDALLTDLRNTPRPKPMKRYREDTIRKVIKRFKDAFRVLIGRR